MCRRLRIFGGLCTSEHILATGCRGVSIMITANLLSRSSPHESRDLAQVCGIKRLSVPMTGQARGAVGIRQRGDVRCGKAAGAGRNPGHRLRFHRLHLLRGPLPVACGFSTMASISYHAHAAYLVLCQHNCSLAGHTHAATGFRPAHCCLRCLHMHMSLWQPAGQVAGHAGWSAHAAQ